MFLRADLLYIVGMADSNHALLADQKDNDRLELFCNFELSENFESRKMINLAIKQIAACRKIGQRKGVRPRISQRTATILLMAVWEYQMLSPDEQLSRRKLGEQILSME